MKITCQKQELAKALNIVSKAVTTRSTMPVLKGILLKAYPDGRLTLSSSDLEISIQDTIAVETEEAGSIVVMARKFNEIVRNLPGEELTIHTLERNGEAIVEIQSVTADFEIIGISADEFPVLQEVGENTASIPVDNRTIREMIEKTKFAASVDESRGIITGILLEIDGSRISTVAIDGYRMAINRRTMPGDEKHKFVISAKIMDELSKILSDQEEEETGTLYLSDRKAVFVFGNVQAELKLLEGDFIDYRSILPKNSGISVRVNRKELMESIQRASLFANAGKNNLVKFQLKENILTVSSKSEEGKATEDLVVEKTGENLEIGFNARYLLDIIRAVDDEEVKLLFNSAIDPCLIVPLQGDAYEHLLLPVRLNS